MLQIVERQAPLEFLIGRDGHGQWLVVETHGLAGGFFTSVQEAYRYVHSGYRERAKRVEVVDGVLEPFGRTCVEIARKAATASASTMARAAA